MHDDVKPGDSLDMEMPTFFKRFFLFTLLLGLLMLAGSAYVVYLLLLHFGVMA